MVSHFSYSHDIPVLVNEQDVHITSYLPYKTELESEMSHQARILHVHFHVSLASTYSPIIVSGVVALTPAPLPIIALTGSSVLLLLLRMRIAAKPAQDGAPNGSHSWT